MHAIVVCERKGVVHQASGPTRPPVGAFFPRPGTSPPLTIPSRTLTSSASRIDLDFFSYSVTAGSGCRGVQGGGAAAGDTGVAVGSGGGTGTLTAGTSPGTWSPQWGWYVTMTPPQVMFVVGVVCVA